MSRRLSIRPVFDDPGLHALERALASPVDGELVVLAGGATVLTPYALAGLRAIIDAERLRGEHITLELPRDGTSLRRFVASGFLADLGISLEPAPRRLFGAAWPGVRLHRMSDISDVEAFAEAVWRACQPHGRRLAHDVLQAAEELTSNVLYHSADPLGAVGLLEVDRRRLELVVVDRGEGVRAALARSMVMESTDIGALTVALGLGPGKSPGAGLPELVRIAKSRHGLRLIVRSGHGEVRVEGEVPTQFEEFGDGIGGFAGVLRRNE
jgi:hypothetical protein